MGSPGLFRLLSRDAVEEMADILRKEQPVDTVDLAKDLDALHGRMAEYHAAQIKARAQTERPDGPSRANLKDLYARLSSRLAELRHDIETIRQAEDPDGSAYAKARYQIVARVRQIASRRTRRPKVTPVSLADLQNQLQLLEDAVIGLYEDHSSGRPGVKKHNLEDEYVLGLEEIYCQYTQRDYAPADEESRFVAFAAIAFACIWTDRFRKENRHHNAISKRFARLDRTRRQAHKKAPPN